MDRPENFGQLILSTNSTEKFADYVWISASLGTVMANKVLMHINSDYRRKKEEILSALKKEKSLLEGQGGDDLEKTEKIESIENDVLLGVVANLKRDESDVADFGSLSKGKFIIDTSTGKTTLFGIRSVIKSKKALERLPESNYENYLNVKKALEFSVANYSYLVLSDVFDRISNLMVNDISSEGREKAEQFLIDNRKYRYGLNMIESIMDLSSKYGNDPDITRALLAVYLLEEEEGQLRKIKKRLYAKKGIEEKRDSEEDDGEGNKEPDSPDSYEYKILQELEKIKKDIANALKTGSEYKPSNAEKGFFKEAKIEIDDNTSLQEANNLIEKKIKEIREKQEKTEKRIEKFINELEEKLKNETPEEKAVKRQIVREILDSLNIKEVADPVSLIDEGANFQEEIRRRHRIYAEELMEKIRSITDSFSEEVASSIDSTVNLIDILMKKQEEIREQMGELQKEHLKAFIPIMDTFSNLWHRGVSIDENSSDISFVELYRRKLKKDGKSESEINKDLEMYSIVVGMKVSDRIDSLMTVFDAPPSIAKDSFASALEDLKEQNKDKDFIYRRVITHYSMFDEALDTYIEKRYPEYRNEEKQRLKNIYLSSYGEMLTVVVAHSEVLYDEFRKLGLSEEESSNVVIKGYLMKVLGEHKRIFGNPDSYEFKDFIEKDIETLSSLDFGNINRQTPVSEFVRKVVSLYNSTVALKSILSGELNSEDLREIFKNEHIIFDSNQDAKREKLYMNSIAEKMARMQDEGKDLTLMSLYSRVLDENLYDIEIDSLSNENFLLEGLYKEIKARRAIERQYMNKLFNGRSIDEIPESEREQLNDYIEIRIYGKILSDEERKLREKLIEQISSETGIDKGRLFDVYLDPVKIGQIKSFIEKKYKENKKTINMMEAEKERAVKHIRTFLGRELDKATPSIAEMGKILGDETYFNFVRDTLSSTPKKIYTKIVFGKNVDDCFRRTLIERGFHTEKRGYESQRIRDCLDKGIREAKEAKRDAQALVREAINGDFNTMIVRGFIIYMAILKEAMAESKATIAEFQRKILDKKALFYLRSLLRKSEEGGAIALKQAFDQWNYENMGFSISVMDGEIIRDALENDSVYRTLKNYMEFDKDKDIVIFSEDEEGKEKALIIRLNNKKSDKIPTKVKQLIEKRKRNEISEEEYRRHVLTTLGLDEGRLKAQLKNNKLIHGYELLDKIMVAGVYDVISHRSVEAKLESFTANIRKNSGFLYEQYKELQDDPKKWMGTLVDKIDHKASEYKDEGFEIAPELERVVPHRRREDLYKKPKIGPM